MKLYEKDINYARKIMRKGLQAVTNPGSSSLLEKDELAVLNELKKLEEMVSKYNKSSGIFFAQLRILYFQFATETITFEEYVAGVNQLCTIHNVPLRVGGN